MRSPASDRYESDPQFKTLVDLIRCELEQSHFTPTELREAVMLACCLYEYQHIRPLLIFPDDVLRTMPGMRSHLEMIMNRIGPDEAAEEAMDQILRPPGQRPTKGW